MSLEQRAEPAISVVVACVEAGRTIERCLAALDVALAGLDAEVIVVDASRDGTAARAERWRGTVPTQVIRRGPGTIVPMLWADGLAASRGRAVAFSTGHCLVTPGWAHALLDTLRDGAVGAGGPLALDDDTSPTDWAVYFLRYSAFLPFTGPVRWDVREIAGDNAAYRRDALDRHASSFAEGFWEVDFHRRVRAEGGRLAMVPEAVVRFGRSFPFATIASHRFTHGRQFGAERSAAGTGALVRVAAAAPVVPLVLLGRIARRIGRREAGRYVQSLPALLALASAWAAGEACGALAGPGPGGRH